MSFKGFLNQSSLKLKAVSPGIMTVLSIGGLIATTILTVRATIKTEELVKDAEAKAERTMSNKEIVQIAAKPFAPVLATGCGTALMMVGAHRISKAQLATLTAGYAALNKGYKEYEHKIKELFGEDGCKKIRQAIAQDKAKTVKIKPPKDDDKVLYFESTRGEFFEKTELEIIKAEYELNRRLAKDGFVSLNTFYDMLDLKPIDNGDEIGWSYGSLLEQTDLDSSGDESVWVEFSHEEYELEDGLHAIQIIFPYPPVVQNTSFFVD